VDQQSLQVPASTVSDYIDHQLSEMEAEYRMYDHDRVENGEDAFPDACEGCPHYGGGLSDYYVALATRGAGSNRRVGHGRHDVQKEIRGLATLHDCHRIPTWITQWETRYEGSSRRAGISTSRSRLTWA